MDAHSKLELAPGENYIPTGLPGGFFIYNAEGDEEIYFAEQNVIELFGCKTMEEFRAYTHNSFKGMVHPDDLGKIENDISAQTIEDKKRHDYVRYRILTKQGEVRYIEDFGHLLHGKDGRSYFYVYIVDVDKDEFYNRSNNSLAESQVLLAMEDNDRLTGLTNMRAFYEEVQAQVFGATAGGDGAATGGDGAVADGDGAVADGDGAATGGRSDGPVVFAHFDILNFKVFNEEYGFQRGDDLLCRLAQVLRNEFPYELVARFSNDHFVVCAQMSVDAMEGHVARVHGAMLNAAGGMRVEVKAGLYELEPACSEVGTACDHARLACNTVKRRYDMVYGIYDGNLYERLRLQQHVVDTVDEAVDRGYLKVYYQPIVRIATNRICGYEALVRWDDPEMGFLPPAKFVITLEDFRMIHKVDRFVLEQVCRDLRALMDAGEPVVPVSINLSRVDFELCDIFDVTEKCCERYGIARDLLDIEVTESAFNGNAAVLIDAVRQFRAAGYRIWVDDFGSGYSALNSLLDYEFDVLKLDMGFLRTYDKNPRAAELIALIVRGAKGMDAHPLQEGVESAEHLDLLRGVGCEMAQGYYFSRPLPLEESRAFTRSKGLGWEQRR